MENNFDRVVFQDPRVSINNFENIVEERMPVLSKSMQYNTQTSRSASVHGELQRSSTRQSKILEQEMFPLQRVNSHTKSIPKNFNNHTCTDVPCLIVFVCFIFAWVYVATYALSQGNLNNVLVPTDSKNTKCGLDSGVRDKKMLFFFNLDKCLDPMTPIAGCDTKQICVESCPDTSFIWQEIKTDQKNDFNALKEKLICEANINKTNLLNLADIEKSIADNLCSGWYLKSKSLFNHCIWDFTENFCDMLPNILSGRKPRSHRHISNIINIKQIQDKFSEFVEGTKSMCLKSDQNIEKRLKEKIINSNSNFHRIVAAILSHLNYDNKSILAEHVATDLQNSWKVIILAVFTHLLTVLIFITLLRWLAAPLVWTSICGVILGLCLSCIYSYRQYRFWSTEPHVPHHSAHLVAKLQNVLQTADVWLYILIVLGLLLTIVFLIVFVIRKRINIAIAIIKEASKAITNIKSSIFFPIFPGILYIVVTILASIIMLYLSSIGEFKFTMIGRIDSNRNEISERCICNGPESKFYQLGDACVPELFEKFCHIENDTSKPCIQTSCSFNEIVKSQKTQWFMLLNIFAYLWVTFFISAYEDMVLACVFAIWYWTFNKKNVPKFPLFQAMWITTAYHLGTLAFGSLILTACRMIRYILEIIEKKAKAYNNTLTRAVLCCMKCFFWLLENFLRFINRNAYITCAIHSTNFCGSSKEAFTLVTQNVLRVYTVDKVSDFLFFLSTFLVTGCTSFITYLFLITYPKVIPVYYPIVPVALVAVISYIMAHFIFSTYSMAVDTLFFCFLEDSSQNDGSAENPFYMSKELRKLLGKSQRKLQQITTLK